MKNNLLYNEIESIVGEYIPLNQLKDKTVFITGATGAIGSYITRILICGGINVIALVRNIDKAHMLFGDKVKLYVGCVEDLPFIEEKIDYIIHTASPTSSSFFIEKPVETIDISINGTKSVLELAKQKKVIGMVYLSSMEVYGCVSKEQNPVTENKLGFIDILNKRSSYSEGKRMCELLCSSYYHEYGVPVKIARLANTFGVGVSIEDNRFFMQLVKAVLTKKDIVLHTEGKSISNFCYMSDAALGIFTILIAGNDGEAYNVCNDTESRSIREIAEMVADEVANGVISVKYDVPVTNSFGYAPDTELRLSSCKLREKGWIPKVSMKEAYERLIASFRDDS